MRWLLATGLLGLFGGAGLVLLDRAHVGGFADGTPKAAADLSAGKYRGVILWTEMKPPPVLVAPRPSLAHGVSQPKQTLSIPFDGVYWFYKFPDRQPPKDSYSARGSPSATVFRSADSYPLQMEARQNFVELLDLSCCNRVEVEIVNADRGAGAVSLELTIANQRLPGEPSQSLGRAPVKSMPMLADGLGVQPATEVLSFAVPSNSRILQFDSARVRFLRAGARSVSSARIAVQRFILVPRGF